MSRAFSLLISQKIANVSRLWHYFFAGQILALPTTDYLSRSPDLSQKQGSEFQLAAGKVIRHEGCAEHDHISIGDHGNFLARRKRTGCFSFLPGGPRTLFFYELDHFDGVTMNQLMKVTVSYVFVLGGTKDAAAYLIAFARLAATVCPFHILSQRKRHMHAAMESER
uniref:Uncharacterized protein n=1 Tax=Oryza meridionalis TaxID=40149 RepID=A0A0E0CTY1_9ORYZ